jgi:hypothetical protein
MFIGHYLCNFGKFLQLLIRVYAHKGSSNGVLRDAGPTCVLEMITNEPN